MSKICIITGKKSVAGNKRSHALNANKRKFLPNIHFHRFWIENEKRFITLRISSKGMRIIDKKGVEEIIPKIKIQKSK